MDSQISIPPSARDQLFDLIWSFTKPLLIYSAARLQIADLLKDGPKHAQALAETVQIEAGILHRFLRGLAWCGLLVHQDDNRFSLTPMGELLRSDVPNSLYEHALSMGELDVPVWKNMYETLQSGETGAALTFGMEIFDYFDQNPAIGSRFDRLMGNATIATAAGIVNAYDFSPFNTVIDIGGGNGTLMTTILKANPNLHGIIFDLPHVAARTSEHLKQIGVADRCDAVGGDFFDAVPTGGDVYLMKWVLHDWSDERSLTILKNYRAAMTENARLLVVDMVMPEQASPTTREIMWDLHMMVMVNGIERTESQFRELFSQTGFKLSRIIPIETGFCIIEGMRM
jgi:hypothetical protein